MRSLARAQALRVPMQEFFTPAQRAAAEAFRQRRREIEQKHGAEFAALWASAQRFIEQNGRVRLPPTKWDFAAIAAARAAGNPGEYTPEQRVQMREFWGWYLRVEGALMELIELIYALHGMRSEHGKLHAQVCCAAHPIYSQYHVWLRDGRILWLPRNRGGDPELSVVQRLGRALIDCDTGPVAEDGDPGPQWEPMP